MSRADDHDAIYEENPQLHSRHLRWLCAVVDTRSQSENDFAGLVDAARRPTARKIALDRLRRGPVDVSERLAIAQILRRTKTGDFDQYLDVIGDEAVDPSSRACVYFAMMSRRAHQMKPENFGSPSPATFLRLMKEFLTTQFAFEMAHPWLYTAVAHNLDPKTCPLRPQGIEACRSATGTPAAIAYVPPLPEIGNAKMRAALLGHVVLEGGAGARCVLRAVGSGCTDRRVRRDIEAAVRRMNDDPACPMRPARVAMCTSRGRERFRMELGVGENVTLQAVVALRSDGTVAEAHARVSPMFVGSGNWLTASGYQGADGRAIRTRLIAAADARIFRSEPVPHKLIVALALLDGAAPFATPSIHPSTPLPNRDAN